jgi:hypothetical protein
VGVSVGVTGGVDVLVCVTVAVVVGVSVGVAAGVLVGVAVADVNVSDAPEPSGYSRVRKARATDGDTDPSQSARTTKDTVCPWRALRYDANAALLNVAVLPGVTPVAVANTVESNAGWLLHVNPISLHEVSALLSNSKAVVPDPAELNVRAKLAVAIVVPGDGMANLNHR